jgi:hypothetical protein
MTNSLIAILGRPQIAVKTSTTVRRDETGYEDDPHLFAELLPNSYYAFQMTMMFDPEGSTPDIDVTFTCPVGSTINWRTTSGTIGGGFIFASGQEYAMNTSQLDYIVNFHGFVYTAGTGGLLQFRWQPAFATAQDVVVQKGSSLRVQKAV